MKTAPCLNGKLVPGELIWSYGHKSRDTATQSAWDDISNGMLSECERPREIAYRNKQGAIRWAVTVMVDQERYDHDA